MPASDAPMTSTESSTDTPGPETVARVPRRRGFGVDVGGSGIKGGVVDLDTGLLIGGALVKTGGDGDMAALQAAIKAADFASTRGNFAFGVNQHPVQDWYMTAIEADEAGNPKIVTKDKILEARGDVYAADCKM